MAAIYAAATFVATWPIIFSLRTALPHDAGDPALVSWMFWWNAHAVPLTSGWWNAPIFFPHAGAFAFSETVLGLAPLSSLVQWLGGSPVVAYNVVYVLSAPLAAGGAHALAHRLTGRHDAALIAGLSYGFNPYRISQIPHLQMLASWWMPFALLALHAFIETKRRRWLVLLALCWTLNGLTSGYYLVFFAILAALWIVWFVRDWRTALPIAATLAIASLPLLPVLAGAAHRQAPFAFARGMQEIEEFSADVSGFWSASSMAISRYWTLRPSAEQELYPGAVILALATIGGVIAWRRQPKPATRSFRRGLMLAALLIAAFVAIEGMSGGWQFSIGGLRISLTRPYKVFTAAVWLAAMAVLIDRRWLDGWRRRSVFMFYGGAAVVLSVIALGPVGRAFGLRFLAFAPYSWLMALPGGHALRVPARLAMLVILCLGQAAALAVVRFWPQLLRTPKLALLTSAIFVEGWIPVLATAPAPERLDLSRVAPNLPVLVLPRGTVFDDAAAMLSTAGQAHALINGYSGYSPPNDDVLVDGLREEDPSVLAALASLGPIEIAIDHHRDKNGRAEAFVRRSPVVTAETFTDRYALFRLPKMEAPPRAGGDPVTIAAVTSPDGSTIPQTIDGRRETRWTWEKQEPGNAVKIDLGREITVSRLEFDLGLPMLGGYPRRLRVTREDGTTLWEGPTAGAAMLGALADPIGMPVVINLSTPSAARRLDLTLLTASKAPWTIAEIRVYGR